jgi:ribonuclease R
MLLRSMQQAIYTPVNSGHFGLSYLAYTHFTSPIRRYPDLLVHRVIKAILARRKYVFEPIGRQAEAPPRRGARPERPSAKPTKDLTPWEIAGAHTSACERRADEASRDVEAWLKCKYMRERLGEEFAGTVSSVAPFGLFVTLDDLYVDGLVHITELGGEYYRHDEVRQELRGERSGVRYTVGTPLRVQVSRVDLDGRRIDFRLVREGEGDRLLTRGRAARSGTGTAGEAAAPTEQLAQVQQQDREAKAAARAARKVSGRTGSKVSGKKAVRAVPADTARKGSRKKR